MRFLELKIIGSIAAFFGSASVANEIYKKLNVVEKPKQVQAETKTETIKEPSPLIK